MSEEKRKFKDNNGIPSYIIDAITSLNPDYLIRSESSPSYPIETFNVADKLDSSRKKKKIEKEYIISNYLIKRTLGQGTFGKVKLGIYLPTGEKVAIKIIEKERIIEKDDILRVKREFEMLALFNNPYIVVVAEIFESSDSYYTVMEYCEGGELFNYIVKNRRLDEGEAAFFYYQLINGLEYIHSLGIVHRDLKPENILLTKEHLLKIIDFGLSNYYKEGQENYLETPCGSPCYASPEMVSGKNYDGYKIDIWSSGIILFAMLCGYLPFEEKNNDKLFEKILECKLNFPKYITEDAKDLMLKILVTDPEKRITIKEIKRHPFYLKGKNIFENEFSICQINKNEIKDKYIDLTKTEKNNSNNYEEKDKKDINESFEIIRKHKNENDIKENKQIFSDLENNNNNKSFNVEYEEKIIHGDNLENSTKPKKINMKGISLNNNPKEKAKITINKKSYFVNNKKLPLKEGIQEYIKYKVNKINIHLNARTKSRESRKNKQINTLDNNKFKICLIKNKYINISPKKNINNNNKILIRRKLNYPNFYKNKFNSKKSLNNTNTIKKENIYINNTIDNEKSKMKLFFNFQKLNVNSLKGTKKTRSTSKKSNKMISFENSNSKKNRKYLNHLFNFNSHVQKIKQKLNIGNRISIKVNNDEKLKFKKSKNELNINLNKTNIKNSLDLEEKYSIKNINIKSKILKTEKIKDSWKYHQKIRNLKIPNINTININKENEEKKNIIISSAKKVLINTTIKTSKKTYSNIGLTLNKKLELKKATKSKDSKELKKYIDKYSIKTIDNDKYSPFVIDVQNRYKDFTEKINQYLISKIYQKKSIDVTQKRNNKNKFDIPSNIHKSTHNSITNTEHYIKKKKNSITIERIKKNYLNKKKLLNEIHKSDNNSYLNTLETLNLTENKKENTRLKNNDLIIIDHNNNDENKEKNNTNVNHIKLNSINVNKVINYKNKRKIIKKNNQIKKNIIKQKKNLNKTANNSNFNNLIKNPFINELNFETSTSNNFNSNNNQTKNNLNKKLKNYQIIPDNCNKKKKPLVTIRNTVINFNMIETGLFFSSMEKKLQNKKRNINKNINQNNSINRLYNNRLFGLCNKYSNDNNNISINNNIVNENINGSLNYINNNSNIKENFQLKTLKMTSPNNDLNFKKIYDYKDINNKSIKIINNNIPYITKKISLNKDKFHMKYNSMKIEDFLPKKHRELKHFKINNFNVCTMKNSKLINLDQNNFHTAK